MSSKPLKDVIGEVLAGDEEVRKASAAFVREFPYNRDDEAAVTRREFCNFLFLTSSALFVGAAGFSGKAFYDANSAHEFPPLMIEGASALLPGQTINFAYPGAEDIAILIRDDDGYRAFGQKCTHLSCPVYYSRERKRLECPCHEGGFDARTGNVLYGPPPRPLDLIEIEVREGEVFAVGRKVRGTEAA